MIKQSESPSQEGKGEGVQLSITLNDIIGSPIISGGDFDFKIEVRNGTDREIEIPVGGTTQPQYSIKRPDGQEITFALMHNSEPQSNSIGGPSLIKIVPGETWNDYIPVDHFVDITLPGRYIVSATLDWKGIHAKATPLVFDVLPARFEGMALSQGRHEDGTSTQVVLFQKSPGGPEAVIGFYRRKGPIYGLETKTFKVDGLMRRGPLPANTIRVLAPYLNYEIGSYFSRWIISQTPQGVNIGHSNGSERTQLIPEYKVLDILTPLAIRTPILFFWGILRDGRNIFHLAFARLDYPIDSEGFPIPESIPKTLQFKPIFELDDYIASSVALGPHALGSPMAVGLALRSEDLTGTEFIIMKVSHDGEIEAKKSFEIPGVTPLKAVTLNINTEGKLRVAFVVKEKKSDAIRLVKIIGTDDLAMVESPRTVFVADRLDLAAKLDLRSFEDHWGGAEPILLIRQPGKPAMVFDGGKEALYPLENDIPYDRPVELVLSSNGWNALVMYTDHVAVIEMMWF